MHRKLIELAFKKAKEDLVKEGESKPSPSKQAEYLSNAVHSEMDFSYHPKNFQKYYNQVFKEKKAANIKQPEVVQGLSRYLGYDSYEGFMKAHQGSKKILRITILSILLILLAFFIIKAVVPDKRWMEWQDTEYVETSFDATKLKNGRLKLYKEERIRHFKKIAPDCNTIFFKADRQENLWYGKNRQGELEYFTDLGRHPETGKTLKPITTYMIKKYICPEY